MSETPFSVTIHPGAFPAAFRADLLEGLRARRVPGKWLYHSPAQAQRWLAYHQAYSPSRSDPAVTALYHRAFAAAAGAPGMGPPQHRGALHVVGVGCGGGAKEALLLAVLLESGWPEDSLTYTPMDASPALVLEAAHRAGEALPGVPCHPLVADLEKPGVFAETSAGQPPHLFCCLGILPNLRVEKAAAWLGALLRPEDCAILSANLAPGGMEAARAAILPQYDNPPARAWYEGGLRELGFDQGDLALSVAAELVEAEFAPRPGEVWRAVVKARVERAVSLELFGEELSFQAGEELEVFFSNRFTPAAVEALLQRAGLELRETWSDGTGEEGVFLCRKGA